MNWFLEQAKAAADECRPWNWTDVRALTEEFERHHAMHVELLGAHDILDTHEVEKVDGEGKALPLTSRIHLLVAKLRGNDAQMAEAARQQAERVRASARDLGTALLAYAEGL